MKHLEMPLKEDGADTENMTKATATNMTTTQLAQEPMTTTKHMATTKDMTRTATKNMAEEPRATEEAINEYPLSDSEIEDDHLWAGWVRL